MLAIVFVAILGYASAQTNPGYQFAACAPADLQRCQSVFNDAAGIDPSLGVQQYDVLKTAIQGVWASNGAAGLLKTCMAFKLYSSCFSSDQEYFNCAKNPLGLLVDNNGTSTGITKLQALGYTKIFNQFDFACGAGFSQFANNDACGSSVFTNRSAELDVCESSLVKYITNNPTTPCNGVLIAKNCVQNVFTRQCGNIPELQWWGCQYERTGTQKLYPQCSQIYCTYNEKAPSQ